MRLAPLAFGALLATGSALAADPYVGATVDSGASHYALICGTCPIDAATDDRGHAGGAGAPAAAYSAAAPGWSVAASASLDGPNGLPQLGGFAFSDILVDPSIPKTFFYKDNTFSQALQRYDYTGSNVATYTIDFTLSGTFTLGAADAASLMSVMGGFTVYGSNYNPFGEFRGTVLGTQFVSQHASVAGLEAFSLPGSISFTVNPGDAFYVWGALSVISDSSHQVIGTVDASHTLAGLFTQGDVSQLVSSTPAVPELPQPALLLAGLALLSWRRLRPAGRDPS